MGSGLFRLVDSRDELVLDDRAVLLPVFSVFDRASIKKKFEPTLSLDRQVTYRSKSRPHLCTSTVMKKTE